MPCMGFAESGPAVCQICTFQSVPEAGPGIVIDLITTIFGTATGIILQQQS